ncbi:MAG TPA: DUF2167 domain-containing protein [Verrucomicrobiae bacterium]|nr:DUF2167 domain-containing protein [Verrucomicrobiae bacterium]
MKSELFASLVLTLAALVGWPMQAQDAETKEPRSLKGPATAQLTDVAQIALPAGYMFLDGKQTRAMMKAAGEPSSGNEVGFLRPTNGGWAVYFEYDDVGYVKDDEKDKLDADKLLKAIKAGNDEANKERERYGSAPLIITGWEQEPQYDDKTHNLTWAIRATSEGEPVLNYNTRLLGRKGVMEVVLVCDPADLQKILPTFNGLLGDYKFNTGQAYAEYKPGDKVAKYGLGALVLGGAAVGAAKLGLFAWLAVFLKKGWKVVVIAAVALAAGVKKILNKITGNRTD